MTVFVCKNDENEFLGVYATVEAAKLAHPLESGLSREYYFKEKPGWRKTKRGVWDNGCRLEACRVILEIEPMTAEMVKKEIADALANPCPHAEYYYSGMTSWCYCKKCNAPATAEFMGAL